MNSTLILLVVLLILALSADARKKPKAKPKKGNPKATTPTPEEAGGGGEEGSGDQGSGSGSQLSDEEKAAAANKALQDALGPKATMKPLNSGAGPVMTSSDLDCGFDILQTCAWSSTKDSSVKWGMVDANVDAGKLGAKNASSPFGAAASGPTGESDEAILVSNVIPCQKEDGQLSFGHFLSEGVTLKVCRKGMDKAIIQPCQEFTGSDPSAVCVVPGGSPEQFRLAFIATNFQEGGVALIKNVQYGAKICQMSTK